MTPARLLLAGAVMTLVCAIGAWADWPAFLHAWLAAAITVGLLPLGAMAALMTWGLTGGGWGQLAAPIWRAMAACLPLFALAMLPLLFGLDTLFSWTRPAEQLPEVVRHKTLYLNVPFFILRFALYFAVWTALAFFMGLWSFGRRPGTALCAGGLVALLYSLTFFGVDWLLSLEPKFYTDVFGLWLCVMPPGAACALAVLALAGANGEPDISRRADLAALWLSLLLGWAFLAFAQYIIIWSGNIPHEIGWYLHRGHGLWRVMSWAIFFLYFALPFLLLMSGPGRRSPRMLTGAALLVLLGYVLQVQWWVLPALQPASVNLLWLGPAALAALGLLFAAGVVRFAREARRG